MEETSESFDCNYKYLLEQLITARKEINNLRQQIKTLKYVHEKDVNNVKSLLTSHINTPASYAGEPTTFDPGSANQPSTSESNNDCTLTIRPIGIISTWFPNKKGTPRQPAVCGKVPGKLTLDKSILTNPKHALQGLEGFSHMWIIFHFHKNEPGHIRAKVAPPRLNGLKTGVFSTRSPHRPNPIGLSLVKIIKIEDNIIFFQGVDMVDKTPVLDVKPYIPVYDDPLHVEKMLQPVQLFDEIQESSSSSVIETSMKYLSIYNKNALDEENCTGANVQKSPVPDDLRDTITSIQPHINLPPTSPLISTVSLDVSRDEEIAIRLQAKEFEGNCNFENSYSYNQNVNQENNFTPMIIDRITPDLVNYVSNDSEVNDVQNPRTSRLLDGADNPSAVCGTDLDLINRRSHNLRLDNSSSSSPIRMGVREAPDGEEGLDLPRFQNVQSSINLSDDSTNFVAQSVATEINENVLDEAVRVPGWILKPNTSLLSVVFSERALTQLYEILEDKADEKKSAVENVLKEDPRSVYLRQKYGNQFYTFLIHNLHITCKFDDDKKIVTVFKIRHADRMCDCGQPEWQCSGHS